LRCLGHTKRLERRRGGLFGIVAMASQIHRGLDAGASTRKAEVQAPSSLARRRRQPHGSVTEAVLGGQQQEPAREPTRACWSAAVSSATEKDDDWHLHPPPGLGARALPAYCAGWCVMPSSLIRTLREGWAGRYALAVAVAAVAVLLRLALDPVWGPSCRSSRPIQPL
jgi:hypothetical protein